MELETFGFHDGESMKVMAAGYAKIHSHATVTDISIVRQNGQVMCCAGPEVSNPEKIDNF